MDISQVLEELPAFTVAERQLLIPMAIEPDDTELTPQEELLVSKRLEDHHRDPASAVSLEMMNESIRSHFKK